MKKLVVIAAIISVWALAGAAMFPLSAQDARPAGANSCLSIPACTFQENSNTVDFGRGGSVLFQNTGLGATYFAAVNLPSGSTIKKVRLICRDNNGTWDIIMRLYRLNDSCQPFQLAELSSSGDSFDWRSFNTTAVSPRYVNNHHNSYFLELYVPGNESDGFVVAQAKVFFNAP